MSKKPEYIKIKKWVTIHAKDSYDKGFYIEALQVLHGWIENKLQELIILTGAIDFKQEMKDIWDISNEFSLYQSSKILYILNQISLLEYSEIKEFNSLRNKVIHKIYYDPYDGVYEGVSKENYDKVFNLGIILADSLQQKAEEKIEE